MCHLPDSALERGVGRPRDLPVDEGPARDLRAMARLAHSGAQLTGLSPSPTVLTLERVLPTKGFSGSRERRGRVAKHEEIAWPACGRGPGP